MLTIQTVGLSIFSDTPKNFYILGGSEYGIKEKYIDILVSKVGPKLEYANVKDVIALMSRSHIIPLSSQVYVVRYDKSFVSDLSKTLAETVAKLDIIGTLVLVYEDDKDITKLDKFFPENTVTIGAIDPKHMTKYLKSDFPDLDDKSIGFVAKHASNYYHAKSMCGCLNLLKGKALLTEKQIMTLFGLQLEYTVTDLQVAIASRNYNALAYITDHYDGDLQTILYQILHVMVELDKIHSSKYSNSPLKNYAKKWTKADVYYMFNHTYDAIKSLRSGYVADVSDMIMYLGALMVFKNIPNMEVLK